MPSTGRPLDAVIELRVDDSALVSRLLGRGRDDDTEITVRRRLQVYHADTVAVLRHYRRLAVAIDAGGDVDRVADLVCMALHIVSSPSDQPQEP